MGLKEQFDFDINGGIELNASKATKKYITFDGKPLHKLAAYAYDEYGIGEPYIILEHSKNNDKK